MSNSVKFATFPFTHKGYNFVSKISETCSYLPQIMIMGDVFIEMNKQAIDELINIDENNSVEAIEATLFHINDGGTEMFLELVGA